MFCFSILKRTEIGGCGFSFCKNKKIYRNSVLKDKKTYKLKVNQRLVFRKASSEAAKNYVLVLLVAFPLLLVAFKDSSGQLWQSLLEG